MNLEIGKASAAETPASTMTKYVCEHTSALMILGGIQAITAQKYQTGFGTRLHVSIEEFPNAPDTVKMTGIIIKDAIAQILSVANIARLTLKPSEDEMSEMSKKWDDSIKEASSQNSQEALKVPEPGSEKAPEPADASEPLANTEKPQEVPVEVLP